MSDAVSPAGAFGNECVAIGRLFRTAHEAEANARFTKLLEILERYLQTGVVSTEHTLPLLRELLAAQERGDRLLVADILEYILAPAFPESRGPISTSPSGTRPS